MSSVIEAIKKATPPIFVAFAAAALVSYFDVTVRMRQAAQDILDKAPKAGDKAPVTLHVFRIIPIEMQSIVETDPKTKQPCVTFTGNNAFISGTTCSRRSKDFWAISFSL